jgi:excisionase family DNA binding protein
VTQSSSRAIELPSTLRPRCHTSAQSCAVGRVTNGASTSVSPRRPKLVDATRPSGQPERAPLATSPRHISKLPSRGSTVRPPRLAVIHFEFWAAYPSFRARSRNGSLRFGSDDQPTRRRSTCPRIKVQASSWRSCSPSSRSPHSPSSRQFSTRQIRRWIKSGALEATQFGRSWRIAENDLALFLATFKHQ